MPRSPRVVLVVLLLVTSLAGYATYDLFFLSRHHYDRDDIEIVHGKLGRAEEIKRLRGSELLQIWLQGDLLPYRGNVGYPAYYRKDLLARLKPGTQTEIGTLPAERAKPWRDRLSGQDFINIYSLSIEGATAFSLDDYNRWAAQNEKIGKVFMPLMFAVCIGSLVYEICKRRRGSSFD